MSKIVYGVSWLEWAEPASKGRKAMKRRCSKTFDSEAQRKEFLDVEKERDDFLYILSQWQEVVL